MEEALEEEDDSDDALKHVRAVNFTFNVEEVTEQIKTEEFAKKQREKIEIFQKKIKAMQKPGAWKIAGSACEEWDWFQGRSRDTYDYTTFRHRKYGYVVQLYDQSLGAWISFSRMSKTRVVHVCFFNGLTEPRKEFWGNDLVQSLVNLTVIQKRQMPFRALADGDPVIFRHSYWHGQIQGGNVVLKHLKKTRLQLHLTPEGFVFVGEPSYLQGGAGSWTELREDGAGGFYIAEDDAAEERAVDEDLGPPLAVWVQGPKRAQKVAVERALDLLKEQDRLWREGDAEWKYVAREARLQNSTKDKLMGQNKESHESHETTQGNARLQDMYKDNEQTLPSLETNSGEGGVGGGGSRDDPPPLEDLIYQDGVGYCFRLL